MHCYIGGWLIARLCGLTITIVPNYLASFLLLAFSFMIYAIFFCFLSLEGVSKLGKENLKMRVLILENFIFEKSSKA